MVLHRTATRLEAAGTERQHEESMLGSRREAQAVVDARAAKAQVDAKKTKEEEAKLDLATVQKDVKATKADELRIICFNYFTI